jgi:hypothetical protein
MMTATLITGLPGAGKTRLIEAWREASLADRSCAVLSNGTSGMFSSGPIREGRPVRAARVGLQGRTPTVQARRSEPDWRETLSGCLCCTARAALPAALARLMQRGPWDHLLIELNGAAHPAPFIDLLRSPTIARSVQLLGIVAVIDAGLPRAGSTRALELVGEQVATADRIWLRGPSALAGQAYAGALHAGALHAGASHAGASYSEPLSTTSEDAWSERFRSWRAFHDLPVTWRSETPPPRPEPVGLQDVSLVLRSSRSGTWESPPSDIHDRRALEALFGRAQAEGLFERVTAVFRTERDWYMWQEADDCTATEPWGSTLFRASNRIEFELALGGPLGDAAGERLQQWLSEIAGCRISGA